MSFFFEKGFDSPVCSLFLCFVLSFFLSFIPRYFSVFPSVLWFFWLLMRRYLLVSSVFFVCRFFCRFSSFYFHHFLVCRSLLIPLFVSAIFSRTFLRLEFGGPRKERLQLHAVLCEVSFVEASRGEDLAEQGLVAINIGGAGERKTKETGTEGSGGREGEQSRSEGSYGCRPQRSRHSTGPAPSEEANELGSLGTPATTNLKRKGNKPAPLRAQQLGVAAFFSPARKAKSGATVLPLVPARSSTAQ